MRPSLLLALILPLVGAAQARADAVDDARALFAQGHSQAALEALGDARSAEAAFVAARIHASNGDPQQALSLLQRIGSRHPLAHAAGAMKVPALVALKQYGKATQVARGLERAGVPGAVYLSAQVAHARKGCAARGALRSALRAAPQHWGRHAARRALLVCTPQAQPRAALALVMLADREPVDALVARDALEALAKEPKAAAALARATALDVLNRMLAERKPQAAMALFNARTAPLATNAVAQALLEVQLMSASGQLDAARTRVEALHADPANARDPDVWFAWARLPRASSAASAAAWLAMANALAPDAVATEARHLAAFHLAQSGDWAAALKEWKPVVSVPGPKRKDAMWYSVRATAELGDMAGAADLAGKAAAAEKGSEALSHHLYWRARFLEQTDAPAAARPVYTQVCESWPARLYGRFACERLGRSPHAPTPAPPAGLTVLADQLRSHRATPVALRHALPLVVALHRVGLADEAGRQFRAALGRYGSLPADLQVRVGQFGQAVGDDQVGILMAERRRNVVDKLNDAAWLALAYPRNASVVAAAKDEDVDANLALAVARTESHMVPSVRSAAGAVGLMQILPVTAQRLVQPPEVGLVGGLPLFDASVNARLGSRYLHLLWDDFAGRPELIACAYNAGPAPARRFFEAGKGQPLDEFLERIHYRETRGYARRVLEAYLNYRDLGGQPVDPTGDEPVEAVLRQSVDF